jgi:SOS-response transcriptional repressor LexA
MNGAICIMTTKTIEAGLVSQKAIANLVEAMQEKKVSHIFPNKSRDITLQNEAINEMLIDEEGNVMLMVEGSNDVILPQFITVCKTK